MKGIIPFLFVIFCLAENFQYSTQDGQKLDWWQRAIFYQIFPRSFKDSNNDGIGDLGGILQKMDFFQDLGVQAIWLSPIYTSPMVDGGYDVSNYSDIASDYGTLDDFKNLLKEAHARGLKVILDFVPNHTSDQHEWFKKSINNEKGYEDYYIWQNCPVDKNGNVTKFPNNWLSVWGGSIWSYNETRKQCYLHQFSRQQPDLNFRNLKVIDEMKKIMTYWLDMGVDGFRVDAVPHIYESANYTEDEPVNTNSSLPKDNYNYLNHTLTKDQPESKALIYAFREFIDNYTKTSGGDTRIFMTEAATDLKNSVTYYGNKDGSKLGAHFSFNFWLVGLTDKSRPADIYKAITDWSTELPSIYTKNWLTGNHDNPRIATTAKSRNVDGYNMLLTFLNAVTITYMGEEIGMENGEVTWDQRQDPSAKNETTFNTTSRDFERTPYQWDDSVNAGFNTGNKTWLPVSSKYHETNLDAENKAPRSHYHVYQKLAKLKKDLSTKNQSDMLLQTPDGNKDVLQITRILNDEVYSLVFNMGESNLAVKLNVTDDLKSKNVRCEVLVASVDASHDAGETFDGLTVNLKPGDSMILKISNGATSMSQNSGFLLLIISLIKYVV